MTVEPPEAAAIREALRHICGSTESTSTLIDLGRSADAALDALLARLQTAEALCVLLEDDRDAAVTDLRAAEALVARQREALDYATERAAEEPIAVDISDFSDEFVAGFLAGQDNVCDFLHARVALAGEPGKEQP